MLSISSHGRYYPHIYFSIWDNMLDVSNIISLPLAFVRSGGIATGDGKASYAGYSLFGWSHMAKSTIYGYALGVNPLAVGFFDDYNRWRGFPLRCLYQG